MMADRFFFSFISLISLCLSRINSPVGNPVYLKSPLSFIYRNSDLVFLLTMEVIDGFVLLSLSVLPVHHPFRFCLENTLDILANTDTLIIH